MNLTITLRLGMLASSILLFMCCSRGNAAQDQWLPLPSQSLEIVANSALDFSGLVASGPAGKQGALQLAGDGKLRFEKTRAEMRFNCAVISNGPNLSQRWPTHVEADQLAEQLRRHGYNLVRFHYADMRLKAKDGGSDFSIDTEALDRFHYLLAALKGKGIYWMIDGMTHPNAGKVSADWGQPRTPDDLKIRLNFDVAARMHWLRLVDSLYEKRNPYTNQSTLSDPALAFVVGANENSTMFWLSLFGAKPNYPDGLEEQFDVWVRSTFSDKAAMRAALADMEDEEVNGKVSIRLPGSIRTDTPRLRLFMRFISEKEVEAHAWMTEQLRKRGFLGPVLAFPEWYAQQDNGARAHMPVTDLHAYIGEVTNYGENTSMLLPSGTSRSGLGAWLTNAAGRWIDRPVVFSEYGQPYPNPYRYEAGLFFPAFAAFQGYSAICRHAHLSIEPAIPQEGGGFFGMRGYSVGIDPIARAGETLATLLFYRGDVAQGRGQIALEFGPDQMHRPGTAFFPLQLRMAALLARFGLLPSGKHVVTKDSTVRVQATPKGYGFARRAQEKLTEYFSSGGTNKELTELVSSLKAERILDLDNQTDIDAGIFQSSTRELTLFQSQGRFQAITPHSEAVALTQPAKDIRLRSLYVRSLSSGALLSASSLDGVPLSSSNRILFILAGDARNTGMRLDGAHDSRQLRFWGELPIQLQRVIADIELKISAGGAGYFSALALNGGRLGSKLINAQKNGELHLRLDSRADNGLPTTFFLWERTPP